MNCCGSGEGLVLLPKMLSEPNMEGERMSELNSPFPTALRSHCLPSGENIEKGDESFKR
jgi:hypothetical protein